MTKAKTVAGKKRERRSQRGRPPIDGIQRETATDSRSTGRPARPTAALRQALIKRADLAGIDLPRGEDGKPRISAEMHRRLIQPWMGCAAGRAIEQEKPADRAQLWEAISGIRKAYARYWRCLGIPDPYPPAARLLYADKPDAEAMPQDAAWAKAPLTAEEEVKAATAAMMACEMRIGIARWVKGCILFDEPVRDRAQLLACMKALPESAHGCA